MQTRFLGVIFQGMQDFRSYNLPGMVSQMAILLLVILLVWGFHLGALGALIAYIVGVSIGLASLIWLLMKKIDHLPSMSLIPDKVYLRHVFDYGIKAHLSNLLGFLGYRMDNYILSIFLGTGAVGIYSVAVGLGERLWMPAEALSSALFPRIASLFDEQEKQRRITP